eukprot:15162702-Ditylum_brightwellii.AAC.1
MLNCCGASTRGKFGNDGSSKSSPVAARTRPFLQCHHGTNGSFESDCMVNGVDGHHGQFRGKTIKGGGKGKYDGGARPKR